MSQLTPAEKLTAQDLVRYYKEGRRDFNRAWISRSVSFNVFEGCNFDESSFGGNNIAQVTFRNCSFRNTRFNTVNFVGVEFHSCNLTGTSIAYSKLTGEFTTCNLNGARLHSSNAAGVRVRTCDFERCKFEHVDMKDCSFSDCSFAYATLLDTTFRNTQLHDLCRDAHLLHFRGVCTIDWRSVCLSVDAEQLALLLALSGMPDVFATYMLDCARSLDPRQLLAMMRSTFISYGGPDVEFARKLNRSLKANGVTTFFFERDAPIGERISRVMYSGVNNHDRVILICSASSLNRTGVQNEIEEVLDRESRNGGETYLMPITLDDYIFDGWTPSRRDLAERVRSRVIADFKGADVDESKFRTGLQRLLRALTR